MLQARTRAFSSRSTRSVQSLLHNILNADDPRGIDLSKGEISRLLRSRGSTAWSVLAAADQMRQRTSGPGVSYVVNRNINFTNTCVKKCGFCAFSRTGVNKEAYHLPISKVVARAEEARDLGATEVCIQAGLPPGMPADLYYRTAAAVKEACPDIQIHGFSPEEVLYASKIGKLSIREVLLALKAAGVTSLPGTSAEVLVPEVRERLAAARISVQQWTEVVRTAHDVGLPTTSTVMYGHCEHPEDLADHLIHLRDLQRASTGSIGGIGTEGAVGITEFVPLSFVAADAPMVKRRHDHIMNELQTELGDSPVTSGGSAPGSAGGKNGRIPAPMRSGPSGEQVLLLHAVARLALNRDIPNMQASWVKEGPRMAQLLLQAGCNDLGGTLINESISTAAGAKHGQLMKPSQIRALVRGLNPDMAWGDGQASMGESRGQSEGEAAEPPPSSAFDASTDAHDDAELRYPWQRDTGYKQLKQFSSHATDVEAAREAAVEPLEAVSTDQSAVEQRFGSFFALAASSEHRFRDKIPGRATSGSGRSRRSSTQSAAAQQRGIWTRAAAGARAGRGFATPRRGLHGTATAGQAFKKAVTFSPSYTLVPTYECFNRCTYCNFRQNSNEAKAKRAQPASGDDAALAQVDTAQWGWMQDGDARSRLNSLQRPEVERAYGGSRIREALVLSGEVSPGSWRRPLFLQRVEGICHAALEAGLLPHTNAGPLSEVEMRALRRTNVSMGLMLEQLSSKLAAGVHRFAPSKKDPGQRLEQLKQAGRLRVPFTTGILCGIGENEVDRIESIEAIARTDEDFGGHIQEVIVQPHATGESQLDGSLGTFSHDDLVATVSAVKRLLPPHIAVQVPPNLALANQAVEERSSTISDGLDRDSAQCQEAAHDVAASLSRSGEGARLLDCIGAGATDLGGISPLDEVNPSHAFPLVSGLQAFLAAHGIALLPRLPVHDEYIRDDAALAMWIDASLHDAVRQHRAELQQERAALLNNATEQRQHRQHFSVSLAGTREVGGYGLQVDMAAASESEHRL